jgi:hypothetical protein
MPRIPKRVGVLLESRRPSRTPGDPDPVVVIVRVTGTVVVDAVKVTVEGLKLQLLFGGKFEHTDGERVAVPVRPF